MSALSRSAAPLALVLALAACGCGADPPAGSAPSSTSDPGPAGADGLTEILLPKLSDVDAATRAAIEERHAALTAALQGNRPAPELAVAFGALGELLMAAEFFEAAAPCFENAASRSPDDARWTYYLAHVHRRRGDVVRAAASFERTLAIEPDHAAAAWWLGSAYLDLDRPGEAEALFRRALAVEGFEVASLYGLGRTALAQERYAAAAEHLERALSMNALADAARYPLGLAYRELGRTQEAEAQMRRRSNAEIRPPDPLIEALGGSVESALTQHSAGVEAALVGDWAKAATHFRRVIVLEPENGPGHLNLAVALHRAGDAQGALDEARRALDVSPKEARAHYVIGAVLAALGRDAEAIRAYTDATRVDRDFVGAHLDLAQLLRRSGRDEEALTRYATVLSLEPALSEAQFGSAIAMVRLGRFRAARDRLAEGMAAHPDEPRFAHALARVLATAPDGTVRDGGRALTLMEVLLAADATTDRATTMAMALAEVGRFSEAADWQREALAAAARGRQGGSDIRSMERNLQRYQRRQPARQPWQDDDPIFRPAPQGSPALAN